MDGSKSGRISHGVIVTGLVIMLVLSLPLASAEIVNIIDDFEDGDLNEWSTTSGVGISTTYAYNGSYSMKFGNTDGGGNSRYIPDGQRNASEYSVWIYLPKDNGGADGAKPLRYEIVDDKGSFTDVGTFWVRKDGRILNKSGNVTPINVSVGKWQRVEMQINYTDGTHRMVGYDQQDNVLGKSDWDDGEAGAHADAITAVGNQNDANIWIDRIYSGKAKDSYKINGEVTDSNNDAVENASISVKNSSGSEVATTTTNQFGQYEVEVANGTYNVTASKQDYSSETKEVVIDGADETVNFELTKFNNSIKLKTRSYIKHGQTTPYSVVVTVDGDRKDVTGNSTVSSGNTSIVTIDSEAEEVVATSDISVNGRTYVRAEWTDSDGNTYTAERNVTVANQTVENIGVLPTFPRMAASLEDQTVQVIIVATMVGAAAALVATSFAGISGMTIIMLLGWIAGFTNNGMAIVTVLMAMFVGMNLAGNVDYTVRRG